MREYQRYQRYQRIMDKVGCAGIKRRRMNYPIVKKKSQKNGGEFSGGIIRRNNDVSEPSGKDGQVPRDPTFLPSFLQVEVPIRNHLLPHLNATDFESLEKVNQACLCAIRQKGYWKDIIRKMKHEKREARHLLERYEVDLTESRDEEPMFFRRLYSRLLGDLENAQTNLKDGVFTHSKIKSIPMLELGESVTETPSRVAIDDDQSIIVAPHRRHFEILKFNHTKEGIRFRSERNVTFDPKFGDCCSVDVKGDLVFAGHQSGLVSVWLWSAKIPLLSFTPNSAREVKVGKLYICAIKIKGDRLMIGSSNGLASMWDIGRLREMHEASIYQIALFDSMHDDQRRVSSAYGAGHDGCIITAIDFHGNLATTTQSNNYMYVWSIEPLQLMSPISRWGTSLNDCISVMRGLVMTAHKSHNEGHNRWPICRLWKFVSNPQNEFGLSCYPKPQICNTFVAKQLFQAPQEFRGVPCSLKTDWETILILAVTMQPLIVFDFKTTSIIRLIDLSRAAICCSVSRDRGGGMFQVALMDKTKIVFKRGNDIHALDFVVDGFQKPEADTDCEDDADCFIVQEIMRS